MDDLYYHPEHFGLKVIAELEHSGCDYEFDTHVAWQHADGRIFIAHDSGCSCPMPFEDHHSLESLDLVTRENIAEVKRRVLNWPDTEATYEKRLNFVEAVGRALN